MGKSILRKASLFISLLAFLIFLDGLLPLTAGEAFKSEKVKDQGAVTIKSSSESVKDSLASGQSDPLMASRSDTLTERLSVKASPQGEKGYYIVQFDGPVRPRQKKELEQLGAQIFDYLPDFAFIVKMNDAERTSVESMKNVRWVRIFQPAYKIEPTLAKTLAASEVSSFSSSGELIPS